MTTIEGMDEDDGALTEADIGQLRDEAETARETRADRSAESPYASIVGIIGLLEGVPEDPLDGATLISEERIRQLEVEKWSADHDDEHTEGALGRAAWCYIEAAWIAGGAQRDFDLRALQLDAMQLVMDEGGYAGDRAENQAYLDGQRALAEAKRADPVGFHFNHEAPIDWPWADSWWKPSTDPVRNLVKAGALVAAEIDRYQRIAAKAGQS